ncbi:hypothetical protein [Fluviispira sanaruensis]|uniref:Uncharacterized protein n=1 Tax=Fluviispira sanaruensis TaxID=2493639 RepID=A0A4P2VNS8_FLUSA|nr:hypothetical protein [Fluviispira sanaruensis]BBH54731.1 hypothetical protein JCM31447_32050 [Fluviispira sanaruensis]
MKRVPVNFSNELHDFLKNIADETGKSFSKVCSDILENFKNERQGFEKKALNELKQNEIQIQKLTNKLAEVEKNLTASLIISKHVLTESATSSFFVKQQYNEVYKEHPNFKEEIFNELKNYSNEKEKIFNEVLRKTGAI